MSLQFPDVDEDLVKRIVDQLKSQGIFDNFRKDCIADVDTRPAYHNLRDNVNRVVADFLAKQPWKDDLNKNKVRETIRKHVEQQNYLETGVNRIVEQVVNPKIFSVFMPKVEDIVYNVMGIEKPLNTDDRRHNRLRMLLSNMPPPSPADTLAEMLPSDLDPVSPGSINESGNESANLNDSITSKIIDEADNVSRDLNKESNLDAMEGSNDSKLSGISDLSSHGSTTKLDISESAHLPDDKTEINCVGSEGMKNNIDDGDKSKQDANEPATAGGFDFDNFSNLKEKLMKSDPLNKNIDKDRFDSIVTSTPILESETDVKDSPEINTVTSEIKDYKEDSMSASANTEESKLDKNQIKSPVSCMYSEDSMTSISSQKSKIKLEKINSLNESTRNSLMDCEESSVSYMDKKFNQVKDHETVSCIESMKEESQASLLSTGSKKSSFAILNAINENSRDVSEISSPDITKNSFDDKKKDRKTSSQKSSNKSERSSHHRSRDTSKDEKYSKDKKSSDDKSVDRSRYDGKDKSRDSSRKDSSNNRDKYSSRSKDDKYRSDKDKSKKLEDSKDRDSRKSSQQDDKNKKDKDYKLNTDDEKKSSNKDSLNSPDDDRNKDRKKDEKLSKDDRKSTKKDEPRKSSDYKGEKELKNSEEQKSLKSKDKHSSDDHRPSSIKDKELKNFSDEDKHSKKDKDVKKTDSKDLKSSSSKDKESKSSSRKSSGVKDVKNGEDEKYSKRDKDSKYSEVTKDKNLKLNFDDGKIKSNNKESSLKSKDKPTGDNKQEVIDKDKKRTSSTDVTSKKEDKKDDKSSRKRRRDNCGEETEKRDHRRSRDRDDGGSKNAGRKIEERKDDKKSRSSSNKQDKSSSSSKKSSKEPSDENEPSDIDLILERIGTSIREDEMKSMTSDEQCGVDSEQKDSESFSNGFNNLKMPKIANNMFEISKIMNARKDYQKKLEESEMVQDLEKNEEQQTDMPQNDDNNTLQNNSEVIKIESQKVNDVNYDEVSNDPENFYGFNPIEIDSTRTTIINFENNLKSIYGSDFNLNISYDDKYFSMTDKNLNNISYKNVTNLINDCRISDTGVCKSLTEESQILSPLSKTFMNGCVNETDENLDDPNTLNSTPDCDTTKLKIPEIIDEKIQRKSAINSQDKTLKIFDSTLEKQPVKQGADDAVSLNESSSSEVTFSLPPLTEDMLDNFMKENILNKSEDSYASSESEVEDSTSSLVSETCPESTNKIGNYKLPELPQPKEKANLQRGSQRYDNRDLYKPRPLFSNSSRRNRVLNKNDSELARGTKRSSDSMEFSENKKPR